MFKKTSLSRQMLRGTDEHLSHPTKTKTNRPDKHPPPHTHATSSRGLGSKDHEGLRSKTLESVCWALRAFGREELKKKNEEEVENASMLDRAESNGRIQGWSQSSQMSLFCFVAYY